MRKNSWKLPNGKSGRLKFHKKRPIQKRSFLNYWANNRRPTLHPPNPEQHPPRHKTLQHFPLQISFRENRWFRSNKKPSRFPLRPKTGPPILWLALFPVLLPTPRRPPNSFLPTTIQPEFLCLWDSELRLPWTTFPIGPQTPGFQIRCLFTRPSHFPTFLCHDHQNGDYAGTVECEQRGVESGVWGKGKRGVWVG
jgi:hypothetical protein